MVLTKQFKYFLSRVAGSLIFGCSSETCRSTTLPEVDFHALNSFQKFRERAVLVACSCSCLPHCLDPDLSCLDSTQVHENRMEHVGTVQKRIFKHISYKSSVSCRGRPSQHCKQRRSSELFCQNRTLSSRMKNSNILIRERPEYGETRRQHRQAEKLASRNALDPAICKNGRDVGIHAKLQQSKDIQQQKSNKLVYARTSEMAACA